MKFEIVHSDGTIHDMTLTGGAESAVHEVAKWPDTLRSTVVEIREVSEFTPRAPSVDVSLPPATTATLPAEVKDIMVSLAETLSLTRQDAQQAQSRIAALESEIAALKGAV